MTSPQFQPRTLRPMRPEQYRRAAKELREWAAKLDARADAQTPTERRALGAAVYALARYVSALRRRHAASVPP